MLEAEVARTGHDAVLGERRLQRPEVQAVDRRRFPHLEADTDGDDRLADIGNAPEQVVARRSVARRWEPAKPFGRRRPGEQGAHHVAEPHHVE